MVRVATIECSLNTALAQGDESDYLLPFSLQFFKDVCKKRYDCEN
jgi:hypothetical protein